MQKPDFTCWQGWQTNPCPAKLVSQAHCTAAPTALATEAGDIYGHLHIFTFIVRDINSITTVQWYKAV